MAKAPRHCGFCGSLFDPHTGWAKFCGIECSRKFRWVQIKEKKGLTVRHCRQCGKAFEIVGRPEANRWHCSLECSTKSARDSRSKFYQRNPGKIAEYHATSRAKIGPDGNQKRFYAKHPNAPRACQSCGETRVLDIAHKPEHRRNGAHRSIVNTKPEQVWILCPTCHALLDRMHYSPKDLGLH